MGGVQELIEGPLGWRWLLVLAALNPLRYNSTEFPVLSPFHSAFFLSYFNYGCWEFGLGFWIEFCSAETAPPTD